MTDDTIIEIPERSGVQFASIPRPTSSENPDDESDARNFGMVKPWLGNMQPPTGFDLSTVRYDKPDMTLQLDYVYGFHAFRRAKDNLHWVDEPNVIMYHAGAVCVICDLTTRQQRYYQGHTEDVLCLTYCRGKRIAASGGTGKDDTAPIMIWSVDTLQTVQCIKGKLEFGVVAVALSQDASRVFATGSDNFHSVAAFDVATGQCLAYSKGSSNLVAHLITDTTHSKDSRKDFITIGVRHITFWNKKKDQLIQKRAVGEATQHANVSVVCTSQLVLVGNVIGEILVFSEGSFKFHVKAHGSFCGGLAAEGDIVYSGGRDGLVKKWNFAQSPVEICEPWDLAPHSYMSRKSRYVKEEAKRPANGPRALSVVNGKILAGTQLGGIYVIGPTEISTFMEAHFEDVPEAYYELWGLDTHPKEPLFCTSCDDCTLRLWSIDLGSMILMTSVMFPSRCCAFSPDGSMIAVGHQNGAFSVWDAMTLTPFLPFTRKRQFRVQCLAWSPDGRFLALSMGPSNVVDVYFVPNKFEYVGYCDANSTHVTQMDWSTESSVLQCCTSGYELLHFNIPQCEINQLLEVADEVWHSYTCIIGWGVQAIWEGCNDGTDVNGLCRTRNGKYVGVGYDERVVRIYHYPILPRETRQGRVVFPESREYIGHASHVTQVRFSSDDKYMLSAGGIDLSILRWKLVPVAPKLGQTLGGTTDSRPGSSGEPKPVDVNAAAQQGVIRELGATTKRRIRYDDYPAPNHPANPALQPYAVSLHGPNSPCEWWGPRSTAPQ